MNNNHKNQKPHLFIQPEQNRLFFDQFVENMDFLQYIKEEEYPIVVNNSLQSNECMPLLQPIYNFFTNQNVTTLFHFFDNQFTNYMKLLDNLLNVKNYNIYTYDLLNDCDLFNQHIAIGIIRLKATYKDEKEFNFKMDSILFTFHDFHGMKQSFLQSIPRIPKNNRSYDLLIDK